MFMHPEAMLQGKNKSTAGLNVLKMAYISVDEDPRSGRPSTGRCSSDLDSVSLSSTC